jgi:predicted phage terminase large subunit-like protein
MARGIPARVYPATKDGTSDGEPVLMTRQDLRERQVIQGSYIFASQMLLNPAADSTQGFKRDWVRFHTGSDGSGMNRYIIVDPANEKKTSSDYTAIVVIGLGEDQNYYLLDAVRDRFSLTERASEIFRMHRKWRPMTVGYEKYSMQSDIEHIKDRMGRENYNFSITELGGQIKKNDRIRQLLPIFEASRMWLPPSLFRTLYDGRTIDLIDIFLSEEYSAFPVSVHDDMFDAMARIIDPELNAFFPMVEDDRPERYSSGRRRGSAWTA